MDDLNQVTIAGRLTRDPQLRTTRNGTTMCNLRIACNKMFFNIKVWGDAGKELAANASKGDIIQVEGRLDWYEWSPGDGPRREYVGIVANDAPGAVQRIATAAGSTAGGSSDLSGGVGFSQLTDNPHDIAATIAAQSAGVNFGMGPGGTDLSNMAGLQPAVVNHLETGDLLAVDGNSLYATATQQAAIVPAAQVNPYPMIDAPVSQQPSGVPPVMGVDTSAAVPSSPAINEFPAAQQHVTPGDALVPPTNALDADELIDPEALGAEHDLQSGISADTQEEVIDEDNRFL